ncbi:MAG: glycine cleavage T C-terminal barrel domain-containing protein, partial [Bacteroidota bacterium]
SPSLQKAIGLGYVETGYTPYETEIFVEIRNQQVKAKVVKIPFL